MIMFYKELSLETNKMYICMTGMGHKTVKES